jgi:hypothetical protein
MDPKQTWLIEFLSSFTGVLVSIITILGLISSAFMTGWRLAKARAVKDERLALMRKRLEKIYAPLRAVLMDVYITTVSSALHPYFRWRLRRFLKNPDRLAFRYRLKYLFDRGVRKSISVEFGHFPLTEIHRIASTNVDVADPKLLDLIQRVDRARHELPPDPMSDEITEDELVLIDHIWEQYDRLSKKLGGLHIN